MYIFKVKEGSSNGYEISSHEIDKLDNVKSITLNSKSQFQITQVSNYSFNVCVVENNNCNPIKISNFEQVYMPLSFTILPNTQILSDSLLEYETNSCNGIVESTQYPIQVMVASKIAYTLYPSFFFSYKILPTGQLCVDSNDDTYTPIDCPEDRKIKGVEEIYATSVLLGITLQRSSYSCWQRDQDIKIKLHSLEMAFTWFACKELSMPASNVKESSEKAFRYMQLPCDAFTNVKCDTDQLIYAYRHVIGLNETEIDNYIDMSTCVAQTYDCDDISKEKCVFHKPYDVTSMNIRKMIGANKDVINSVIDHYN